VIMRVASDCLKIGIYGGNPNIGKVESCMLHYRELTSDNMFKCTIEQ
jgi:hypothetical protein